MCKASGFRLSRLRDNNQGPGLSGSGLSGLGFRFRVWGPFRAFGFGVKRFRV